jgi:dynein heavy chain
MNKGAEPENKFYEQITDQKKLIKVVTNYMEEDTKLKLVLFKDALDHLLRITRVLR